MESRSVFGSLNLGGCEAEVDIKSLIYHLLDY